jgi:hypothetical protein
VGMQRREMTVWRTLQDRSCCVEAIRIVALKVAFILATCSAALGPESPGQRATL